MQLTVRQRLLLPLGCALTAAGLVLSFSLPAATAAGAGSDVRVPAVEIGSTTSGTAQGR